LYFCILTEVFAKIKDGLVLANGDKGVKIEAPYSSCKE
jgi:hypothetical protein